MEIEWEKERISALGFDGKEEEGEEKEQTNRAKLLH